MTGADHRIGHSVAQTMLDAFASVGAKSFDVTWTTLAGEKEWFRRAMSYADLSRTLPSMLDAASAKQRNIIVRPHEPSVTFVQLDDLDAGSLHRLAPAVFLTLQTSPGNFQAWLAMDGVEDKDFSRRLRKGNGADATASGATRIAGSLNFKDKYAPDFPRVMLRQVNAGRMVEADELDKLGFVANPVAPARSRAMLSGMRARPDRRKWPSYARCVEGAPLNSDKSGSHISRADFVWCMTAVSWGWSVDDTAARLIDESVKAQENGEGYALLTSRNAAAAVERDRRPPPGIRMELQSSVEKSKHGRDASI